ncbi:MAG: hypothetical protein ABJA74_07135, partial [Lapillicoccus sp.]
MNSTKRRTPGKPRLGTAAKVVLVTVTAAAAITGLGVTAASASTASADPTGYSVEAFRETIKPWDSIRIPSLSCPTGWLTDQNLSPGRIVPKGVQVLEPGAIGVTISEVKSSYETDWWNKTFRPISGTDADGGPSTATNWDPFSSHELIVRLHCTTDSTRPRRT